MRYQYNCFDQWSWSWCRFCGVAVLGVGLHSRLHGMVCSPLVNCSAVSPVLMSDSFADVWTDGKLSSVGWDKRWVEPFSGLVLHLTVRPFLSQHRIRPQPSYQSTTTKQPFAPPLKLCAASHRLSSVVIGCHWLSHIDPRVTSLTRDLSATAADRKREQQTGWPPVSTTAAKEPPHTHTESKSRNPFTPTTILYDAERTID